MADARYEIHAEASSPTRPPARRRRPDFRLAAPLSSVELAVADLRAEPLVRLGPLDLGHVAALAEVPDRWPPIIVAAKTMVVLDGAHRVAAARRLKMASIAAHLFEGNEEEAFVLAVAGNAEQGLPLTLAERSRAASRLLDYSFERSDRAIGQICGLDHKTVARLRAARLRPSGEDPQSGVRIGRDRRSRPVNVAALRMRIAEAVAETPSESLREIARRVGASPETVRDVRARLDRGDDPIPKKARIVPKPSPPETRWSNDSACQAEPGTAEFAAWFDAGGRSLEWARFVKVVPLSRAYSVADQARTYAEAWRAFAETLEARTRPTGPTNTA